MIVKFVMLFAGLIVLRAWRDKITFDWRIAGNDNKDKLLWHMAGFLTMLWVAFWGLWMITPISVNFGFLMLLIASITWWMFDIVLNLFRGLSWRHAGDSEIEKALGKNLLAAKLVMVVISMIGSLITM